MKSGVMEHTYWITAPRPQKMTEDVPALLQEVRADLGTTMSSYAWTDVQCR